MAEAENDQGAGGVDDADGAGDRARRGRVATSVEWVLIALLAGAVIFGCGKANDSSTPPPPSSSAISGELGKTVDRVVGDLDTKSKDCIQKENGGPAEAASNCVDRSELAKQVVNQVKAMGITDEEFLGCIKKSVEGLSNADLSQIAGGTSEDAMTKLSGDISSCLGTTRPTVRKFSSVASAIQ